MADATHIFDGLEGFPTHVAHMRDGSFVTTPVKWPSETFTASSLHSLALQWLKEDRATRMAAEASGERRKRGARIEEVSPIYPLFQPRTPVDRVRYRFQQTRRHFIRNTTTAINCVTTNTSSQNNNVQADVGYMVSIATLSLRLPS